jgi:phosphatidylglycerophosphate synthase
MSILATVIGESSTRLWGLSSRERIKRQLDEIGGIVFQDSLPETDASSNILLLNEEYLFEIRTIEGILATKNSLLLDHQGVPAAAFVCAGNIEEVSAWMANPGELHPDGMSALTCADLSSFSEALRRSGEPLLESVSDKRKVLLENILYGNAYRGITDLVTKFLWPRPARRLVHWCADLGLSPNMVTSIGFVLVIVASWLFLNGWYFSGLLAAWVMTLLDTVDGKLARVTIQSSQFGHLFDHGIDILHPPFWYIFWGMSLMSFEPVLGLNQTGMYWLIVIAYIGGRAVEGLFPLLGECTIFTWRPFDAWFRLITARRNPCLIILTGAALLGRPDWGFIGVAFWSALTTMVLIARLLQGVFFRLTAGPLVSWLSDVETARTRHADSYRIFGKTRGAYDTG